MPSHLPHSLITTKIPKSIHHLFRFQHNFPQHSTTFVSIRDPVSANWDDNHSGPSEADCSINSMNILSLTQLRGHTCGTFVDDGHLWGSRAFRGRGLRECICERVSLGVRGTRETYDWECILGCINDGGIQHQRKRLLRVYIWAYEGGWY